MRETKRVEPHSEAERQLETAVREHGGAMLAVARRLLRNEEDARECVQEAYLRAYAKSELFEGRSTFRTWLHRIVVNTALGMLRKRGNRKTQTIDEFLPEFDASSCRIEPMWQFDETVEQILQRKTVREAVHRGIESLPDIYRAVLVLRDIEEYSTSEVAELLETNIAVVKTRLHRARAALKKQMESQWSRSEL